MLVISDGETKHLEDFGFEYLTDYSEPIFPDFSGKTQHIPGQAGYWDFGDEIGSKITEVSCIGRFRNRTDFANALREFKGFVLDGFGQPKILKMWFEYDSDHFFFGKINKSSIPTNQTMVKEFTLSFIRNDPHEYAASSAYDPSKPLKYDESNPYGSKSYPNTQSFKWIYSRHYSGLENYSSLNTDIKITIKGTVKGGSVKHLGSGVSIAVPDITNGTVVIDTEMFNLQLNGRDTIIDGDFFKLSPGDNGFLFEAETANATVSFEWYHKFS